MLESHKVLGQKVLNNTHTTDVLYSTSNNSKGTLIAGISVSNPDKFNNKKFKIAVVDGILSTNDVINSNGYLAIESYTQIPGGNTAQYVFTSKDALTWDLQTYLDVSALSNGVSGSSGSTTAVWAGNRYCAVEINTNNFYTSTDGVNWVWQNLTTIAADIPSWTTDLWRIQKVGDYSVISGWWGY